MKASGDSPSSPVAALFCDHNAGAPVSPEVLEHFLACERRYSANPASPHAPGRKARSVLEEARQRVADTFGLRADDVVFTSGGTEAANMAVRGLGDPSKPVLCADVEHAAVHEPARRRGIVAWATDPNGAAVVHDPSDSVGLVCLVHGQSEVGTLQPIERAVAVARNQNVPLFVDAAQTLGRVPLQSVIDSGAAIALSPHKAGGLRGHGVLLGHELTRRLEPMQHGGAQEFGMRPGTQSPSLASANALAIANAVREQPERSAVMREAREAFLRGLRDATHSANAGFYRVLTPILDSLPNTLMLCTTTTAIDGRNLLVALDLAGVHASRGSACSSGAPTPPRILAAMGLNEATANTCVRYSFGWRTDEVTHCHEAGARVGELLTKLARKK